MDAVDLPALERLYADAPPFPNGVDGWLGRHWLTNAISSARPEVVAWVLSKGVEPNFTDDEGYSPLKSALEIEENSVAVTTSKVDITIAVIDLLLGAGARLNHRMTLDETALHAAVYRSSPRVVAHLLACGADPHAEDLEYEPGKPIDYVAYSRAPAAIKALLSEAMDQRSSGTRHRPLR